MAPRVKEHNEHNVSRTPRAPLRNSRSSQNLRWPRRPAANPDDWFAGRRRDVSARRASDLLGAGGEWRGSLSEHKIALAGRPGDPRRNPDLLSVVSRQGRRSESARTWICAHKTLAGRLH